MKAARLVLMALWGVASSGCGVAAEQAPASQPLAPDRTEPYITVGPSPKPDLSIKVSGNHFVDGKGETVQLRGVNVGSIAVTAIQGWAPNDPWGGQSPNWKAIKSWGANSVRIPLNEASWRGGTCVDKGGAAVTMMGASKVQNTPGQVMKADPGGNYQATVAKAVSEATAAGLYVVMDLHLSAPGNGCPISQNAMADMEHSIAFWSSLAATYKGYPNVIFELFNEPFLDQSTLEDKDPWPHLLNGGGTLTSYNVQGKPGVIRYTWTNAGMQQLLDTVRATGATNVILTAPLAYASSMGGWLQYHPKDSLKPSQVGAVWHAYPNSDGSSLVDCIGAAASCSPQTFDAAKAIIAAGYPIVITEFGDKVGVKGAPLSSTLLPWADTNGLSYMAWVWNNWPGSDLYLITDDSGTPTSGFGTYVKAHYQCRAAGKPSCP